MIERWYKAPVDCVFDVNLAKMPASLFRAWHQLMALASLNGGALPAVEQIAYSLRSSVATIVKRLEALAARRLAALTGRTWRLVDPATIEAGEAEAPASAAERTRRWRERKAAYAANGDAPDEGAGDDGVTAGDAPREEQTREEQMRLGARDEDDGFAEFFAAFPTRTGGQNRTSALAAWREARAQAVGPATIIAAAKAYARATTGQEPRFVVSAARWLAEGRYLDAAPTSAAPAPLTPDQAPGIWISRDAPEWEPWAEHWRGAKGMNPPTDSRNGWRFPALAPPAEAETQPHHAIPS